MRGAVLAIPLLLLLLPVPVAEAQGDVLGVRVIEDPAGDVVQQNPTGTPVPFSTGRDGFIDIRAVDVDEQEDGYFFHVWVAGFPPDPQVSFVDDGLQSVRFAHDTMSYEVLFQMFSGDTSAYLGVDSGGNGEFDYLEDLEMNVDAAAGHLSAFVPRILLGDRDGAPPFPGRSLTHFSAEGRGLGTGGQISISGQAADTSVRGQDTAVAAEGFELPVQFGAAQSGTARLLSPRPFRASNGEAATFIFEVEASNDAEDERLFRLEAVGVPANWQVTFPLPEIRLNATSSRAVPVLASVPFAHQHGRITAFRVELRDLQDPGSVGRVELGLHYTDPAQPAGHHDELYLHSRAPGQFETAFGVFLGGFGPGPTMNTNAEDPHDDGADVSGSFDDIEFPNRISFQWTIPLSPQLQMGLDVDLTRTGAISVPIGSILPMPAARMDGALYAVPEFDFSDFSAGDEPGESILVASILPTPEVDVQASSSQLFESVIVPSKDADYVAYDPALNLELVLNVSFARPSSPSGVEAPVLKAGGHLRLPLLEYADPVSDLFAGAAGLELNLTQGAERRVPPGGSASVDLRATGPAGHYRLRALGPEASWIEVRSDGLHVNDEGVGGARLAIHVPANATADSIVDFVIEAAGGPADAVRSLVRLRVTVDPDAPDESATLGKAEGKGSPGLGPVALVSLLALVALAARRRRL